MSVEMVNGRHVDTDFEIPEAPEIPQAAELLMAASDYARMAQVERMDRDDIAVQRGYERLRAAIENFGR